MTQIQRSTLLSKRIFSIVLNNTFMEHSGVPIPRVRCSKVTDFIFISRFRFFFKTLLLRLHVDGRKTHAFVKDDVIEIMLICFGVYVWTGIKTSINDRGSVWKQKILCVYKR